MSELTADQLTAVEHRDGPLLVLAGPGSGKTRVVTRRIARLVETGVSPQELLAITFTNKAATEMQERVAGLLPGTRVWISTFHRFCARLLRRHAEAVGLKPNYSILDTGDQRTLIKEALQDEEVDPVAYSPGLVGGLIGNLKNDLVFPEEYARRFADGIGNHQQAVVARVYPRYQQRLLASNAVDFDDLLLHVVTLLRENPELRRALDERFRYVLVDEYQDTNRAQYEIVKALSADHPNVCATGDPDQSIYGWRGARIDNILRFEADFPDATVVRLQHNFRSTQAVLRSADRLIAHNRQRKAKSLITENAEGEPVELLGFRNAGQEAEGIAAEIRRLVEQEGRSWSDFALFYRVNSLSRELELALARYRIPYQVAGGLTFYERAEVKDVLAYLTLVHNPDDRAAFRRIVNRPTRGIGKTTQARVLKWADRQGINALEACARAQEVPDLGKRAVGAVQRFAATMESLSLADAGSVGKLLQQVLERTHYVAGWEHGSNEEQERLANVQELLNAARQYDERNPDDPSLEGFLEETSLVSELDALEAESGRVTLMTLHAAKGLEFPVVFVVAVEQNLLPHERSLKEHDARQLEEERRLLFVGMTRARERLYLTCSQRRSLRGRETFTIPSDFLRETEYTLRDLTSGGATVALPPEVPSREALQAKLADREADSPLLTTGAALLNGDKTAAEVPQGFAVGSSVRHPRYGRGTVVEVGGYARRRTVTVEFEGDDRRETFVVAKCPLQPVGL